MMARTGSRGDNLGSVASCPGLRVKYWKLRSGATEIENQRSPNGPGNAISPELFLKKRREKRPPRREKGVLVGEKQV